MASSHAIRVHDLQRDELPLPVAFLLSCLLLIGIALTAVLTLENAVRPVPKPTPLHVVLLQLPSQPPRPLVAPPPAALPPPTAAIVVPVAPSGHLVLALRPSLPVPARRPLRPAPRRTARHVTESQAAEEPPARPPVATSPAKTTSSPPADPAARDSLQARIREAIHSSFRYPEAARVTGTHGTAVVGFLYRDRSALAIRIIQSSLSSVLDRAAIGIVRDAEMPPPGKLAGQTLSLEVPVVFDLSTDDD